VQKWTNQYTYSFIFLFLIKNLVEKLILKIKEQIFFLILKIKKSIKMSYRTDPNDLKTCPYDSSHKIAAYRFQTHLIKCKKVFIFNIISNKYFF
jgi:hypothetical protein